MSDNLRYALNRARLQPVDLAAALAVDPKTVERWLKGRIPYPRHRWAIAELLNLDETHLWPQITPPHQHISDEVLAVYPHRWAVPHTVWRNLFQSAGQDIGILAYSSLFLAEDAGLLRLIAHQAATGTRVRILLGNPESPEVAARGTEEHIGPHTMTARIRNAITLYQPLRGLAGIEFRFHRTVLYNSIYRADEQLLVNAHIYGTPAADAPVIHLSAGQQDGSAHVYLTSFERTWADAEPGT
ncbi:transcriptional regulator [Acrocarpospora phusangensis]|uniref:Transcriptional regulator n=1 Tax=Acrocarpospora phusangensis TaxID=1070424 RepID=A0A919QLI8_9ACTN|nr:XRE family transcriptional regulator [Acrocarpospora phusangensis]GIH28495.1 transcriptional regulator [Acrocarpospora phusangensis]